MLYLFGAFLLGTLVALPPTARANRVAAVVDHCHHIEGRNDVGIDGCRCRREAERLSRAALRKRHREIQGRGRTAPSTTPDGSVL